MSGALCFKTIWIKGSFYDMRINAYIFYIFVILFLLEKFLHTFYRVVFAVFIVRNRNGLSEVMVRFASQSYENGL